VSPPDRPWCGQPSDPVAALIATAPEWPADPTMADPTMADPTMADPTMAAHGASRQDV